MDLPHPVHPLTPWPPTHASRFTWPQTTTPPSSSILGTHGSNPRHAATARSRAPALLNRAWWKRHLWHRRSTDLSHDQNFSAAQARFQGGRDRSVKPHGTWTIRWNGQRWNGQRWSRCVEEDEIPGKPVPSRNSSGWNSSPQPLVMSRISISRMGKTWNNLEQPTEVEGLN